jgi:hypothetical protein
VSLNKLSNNQNPPVIFSVQEDGWFAEPREISFHVEIRNPVVQLVAKHSSDWTLPDRMRSTVQDIIFKLYYFCSTRLRVCHYIGDTSNSVCQLVSNCGDVFIFRIQFTIFCNNARNVKQVHNSQKFMDLRVHNRSNKIPALNNIPVLIQFNAVSIIKVY